MTRARAIARAGDPRAALAAFRDALAGNDSLESGSVVSRMGELHELAGDTTGARDSFEQAARLFASAGHLNNAIAAWQRVVAVAPQDEEALAELARLATSKGYRVLARESAGRAMAAATAEGDLERAFGILTGLLTSFPEERAVWRGWVDQLLGYDRQDAAIELLQRLRDFFLARGEEAGAAEVEDELRELAPPPAASGSGEGARGGAEPTGDAAAGDDERPSDGAAPPDADLQLIGHDLSAGDGGGAAGVERSGGLDPARPEPDLPLVGSDPSAGDSEDVAGIERVTGLEPTRSEDIPAPPAQRLEGLDTIEEVDADGTDDIEPLPLLEGLPGEDLREGSAADDPPAPSGSGDPDPPDPDALPLLGTLPDEAAGEEADVAEPLPLLRDRTDPGVSGESQGITEATRQARATMIAALAAGAPERSVAPADPSTHYDLGVAHKGMGLRAEALAHLRAALAGGYDPAAVAELAGEVLLELGDAQGAVRVLSGALELGEREDGAGAVGVLYWLGRAHERLGASGEARDAYRRAAQLDPHFRDVANRLVP